MELEVRTRAIIQELLYEYNYLVLGVHSHRDVIEVGLDSVRICGLS